MMQDCHNILRSCAYELCIYHKEVYILIRYEAREIGYCK
jgi:hypothetical protein